LTSSWPPVFPYKETLSPFPPPSISCPGPRFKQFLHGFRRVPGILVDLNMSFSFFKFLCGLSDSCLQSLPPYLTFRPDGVCSAQTVSYSFFNSEGRSPCLNPWNLVSLIQRLPRPRCFPLTASPFISGLPLRCVLWRPKPRFFRFRAGFLFPSSNGICHNPPFHISHYFDAGVRRCILLPSDPSVNFHSVRWNLPRWIEPNHSAASFFSYFVDEFPAGRFLNDKMPRVVRSLASRPSE